MLPPLLMAYGGGGNALRPSFKLSFDDLGSGEVSTVEDMGTVTPTFTRATVAWTKLASGLWAQIASGSPRSFYSGFTTAVGSYLGYLAEGAGTQLVTPTASIRDMTDASWVKTSVTAAKTATGIDGVANSASRLTATANGGTVLQTLTAAASSRTYSVWLRRVTGTGTITIQQGATTLDVTASLNSTTYTRVELAASVLNSAFGIIFGTDTDAVDADFNQFEAGAFATSPMAAAGAVRNADVLTYPFITGLNLQGSMFAEVQANFGATATANFTVSTFAANEYQMLEFNGSASTVVGMFDNPVVLQKTGLSDLRTGLRKRACAWSGVEMVITGDGAAVASGVFDGDFGSTKISIGCNDGGAEQWYGPIRRVSYWNSRLPNATLQALTA